VKLLLPTTVLLAFSSSTRIYISAFERAGAKHTTATAAAITEK
jgi:hypothetical protein